MERILGQSAFKPLVGMVADGVASEDAQVKRPKKSWEEIAEYARFPQGLPEGLDRAALRLKPHRLR